MIKGVLHIVKKTASLVLAMVILLFNYPYAFAVGEGNIDGGGGGMGSGTGNNYWNPGNDGVRITVIRSSDGSVVSTPIDFTNIVPMANIIHFGKYSKIAYRTGRYIAPIVSEYTYCKPELPIPRIISSSSATANISEIKRYFCSERIIMIIAEETGFDFDTLINGNYKILIEPIAYLVYNGNHYAMTAHEAALYDRMVSGNLRGRMISLSHKNLPFALFLERSDLGYPAWTGSTTSPVSNSTIISYLGLGVVKFTESGMEAGAADYNFTYRTDTDVITSIGFDTDREYNPDNPLNAKFTVNGSTYTVSNIVIPEGESQLIWFKWRTPSTPQTCTIYVNIGGQIRTVTANIVKIEENEPPDPKANDRNDTFTYPSTPASTNQTATWGAWSAKWHEYWVWVSGWQWNGWRWIDRGDWEDRGWWDFQWNRFYATLTVNSSITPDSKVPTTSATTMKSGYGFNINISAEVTSNAVINSYTQAQTAVSYFPEFNYQNYCRILDKNILSSRSTFQFNRNRYSSYNSRSHFTPIWYPDGSYETFTQVYDVWTPGGMITANIIDSLTINDNLFSDWHVAPK
jgi:hypothetical protein